MELIKSIIVVLSLLLASGAVVAKPHMLTWEWPTTDCDGDALAATDLFESELIYSLSPMPMPSDSGGACTETGDPDAPAGALTVPIPVVDTAVTLNVQPGETYYARIRVSSFVDGNWSVWSDQVTFTVPYGKPNKVQFTTGLVQWEAEMISTTHIYGKKQS
jgi:hypothetical protein